MSAFSRVFALAVVCMASLSSAQVLDQVVAARALGPHWRKISRTAQVIFSGTVLSVESQPARKGRPLPLIVTKFRVDRAILNVKPGQVLAVREWAGAWATHRAMTRGEHLLLFLYPPSKLGLTSPVGGRLGQIVLNPRGEVAVANSQRYPSRRSAWNTAAEAAIDSAAFTARLKSCPPERPRGMADQAAGEEIQEVGERSGILSPTPATDCVAPSRAGTTLDQLERAIRQARKTLEATTSAKLKE
jgi:hypothetical protein